LIVGTVPQIRAGSFRRRARSVLNDRQQFSVRQHFQRDIAALYRLRALAVQPVPDLFIACKSPLSAISINFRAMARKWRGSFPAQISIFSAVANGL
jgi:hypothetical protein